MAALNYDDVYKKLTGDDLSKASDIQVSEDVDKDICIFISKKSVSSENDIVEYARYLTLKNGGGNKSVDSDFMEKIFIRAILFRMKKERPA